jgi:hypothetical protein
MLHRHEHAFAFGVERTVGFVRKERLVLAPGILCQVKRDRPSKGAINPDPLATAHQRDALALPGLSIVNDDVETFARLPFAGFDLRLDGHRESRAVAGEQQVIGESRECGPGVVNRKRDDTVVAHALGEQAPYGQLRFHRCCSPLLLSSALLGCAPECKPAELARGA